MKNELLTGEQVVVRAMTMNDLTPLLDWENRSELWYLGNVHQTLTEAELREFIEGTTGDMYLDGQLRLMIDDLSDRPLGCIDLFDFDRYNERAGVGILIADQKDRKQGYATEALRMVVNYCFTVLHFKQLYCHITVDNPASLKLFEKCGFTQTGSCSQWVRMGRSFVDAQFLQNINVDHG